jgi:Holliday junction resolvase RusA-like endonuclease
VTIDDCNRNAAWRELVAASALRQRSPRWPLRGAVAVSVTFWLPRPKGHYRRNGTLRPSAPPEHLVKPDATKLWRSTEDALTGIVWADDAVIIEQTVTKRYADRIFAVGAEICVEEL